MTSRKRIEQAVDALRTRLAKRGAGGVHDATVEIAEMRGTAIGKSDGKRYWFAKIRMTALGYRASDRIMSVCEDGAWDC